MFKHEQHSHALNAADVAIRGFCGLRAVKELADQPKSIEVSVVIPCLNEQDTLARCIEKARRAFREHHIAGEILVADNGSTD